MSDDIIQNKDNKSTVYVGNLDPEVTEDMLYSAFMPFGEIMDVILPKDLTSYEKHRGFGFVEFELIKDAQEAVSNMNFSKIKGRTVKCSIAQKSICQQQNIHKNFTPVWEQEEWLQTYADIDAVGDVNVNREPKEEIDVSAIEMHASHDDQIKRPKVDDSTIC